MFFWKILRKLIASQILKKSVPNYPKATVLNCLNRTCYQQPNLPLIPMDHKSHGRGQKDEKKYSQSSIDAGVYNKLEAIVNVIQENKNDSKDFKPFIEFCQKGFLNQMVQSWSYYAQVNSHAMFAKSTLLLVKSLRLINQNATIIEHGDRLIKLLLTDYLKVIYRGLNNMRGQITNPMLFLLKELILFDNSKHIEDFISFFDFSLPSLVKIITPSKKELENKLNGTSNTGKVHKTLRLSFIEFWIELINRTPSLLRKDLLSDNFKIMGAWFKYMDKFDSSNIMIQTIDTFINSILNEKSFKRMTKTKILNEFALSKLHHFYHSTNKDLVTKVNQFFLAYGYQPETSVSFPDNCVWFDEPPISGGFSNSSGGAPVTINQREFKLYNKLLFNVLRLFKPWEDDMQSNTLIKILQSNPGLVAPYCAYLTSLGSHDPKMTSYWFGMTLVLGRIISLPIPTFMEKIETNMIPSTSFVMENIFPSSLTKSALTKTLQSDVVVIKQLGCQLLVFAFQKLEKILDLYDRKGWSSSKASLNTLFFNNIPDLSIIVNTLNQVYTSHKANQMISLSLTMILRHYSQCFPNFFSVTLPSANIYQDIMRKESFTGVELTILDNFLQFQEFNSTQTKWWNSTENDSSLFVSLLKLASSPNSNDVTSLKIANLLQSLLNGSVIFREDLLIAPISSLVSSLRVVSKSAGETQARLKSIWKLIDESISRSIKTPYKYVTAAQSFENISPFLVTLAEQWKFINQETLEKEEFELTMKWVLIFFRTMVITGEDEAGIQKMVKECFQNIESNLVATYLNFTNADTTTINNNEFLLANSVDSSYFQYIDLLDYKKLKNITRFPVNDMDIIAILSKIKLISVDENIKANALFKDTIIVLFEQVVKYLSVTNSINIVNNKICKSFFNSILENVVDAKSDSLNKNIFISQQILLVFKELYSEGSDEIKNFLFEWIQKLTSTLTDRSNKELLILVSLAATFLDVNSSLTLSQSDFIFDNNTIFVLLSQIAEEGTKHISYSALTKYLKVSEDIIVPFKTLIENKQIDNIDIQELIPVCLRNSKLTTIFNSLLSSNLLKESDVTPFLDTIKDHSISISIVNVFSDVTASDDKFVDFSKKVIEDCYTQLKELTGSDFEHAIKIFTKNASVLSEEQTNVILSYITTEYEHKYSGVVIDFVREHATFEEDFIVRWMNKMTLYVTKIFSDRTELNQKFMSVLSSFKDFVDKVNIWDKVNNGIINSQLEAIFSNHWVNDLDVLKYALSIIFNARRSNVESEKIVNMIVNNESSPLAKNERESETKYTVTLCLYILFNIDPSKCSVVPIQTKLASFYSGSMNASDKLILKILESIETKLSSSWTNLIYTWDLLDSNDDDLELIGETRLLTQEKEGLILTLRKDLIEHSIQNYVLDYPLIPSLHFKSTTNVSEKVNVFGNFFTEFKTIGSNIKGDKTIYDPYFLILLTVHNNELVKTHKEEDGETNYKFEVKNFISSKLLNFIICSLPDNHYRINEISLSLLTQMLYSLEANSQFKGDNIYKILLKKIIFTIQKNKQQEKENNQDQHHEIAPIMWFFVSCVCDVLTQPSSPLYEKAFRWILNGPLIRGNDLPMVHEVMSPKYSESINDSYYAQLSWVLSNLETGIRTQADFDFLKRRGVIEWLYTLLNNPYLNTRLISMIKSILYRIQRIETGASVLVTRYGALSDLDMSTTILNQTLEQMEEQLRKNSKNSKTIRKKLAIDEQLLNNKELAKSFAEIIPSHKRLREWTEDESDNMNKRICP